ncbi:hypothetical protein ABEB36_013841 [Hypothenemus hampei]|uniref:MADF domain-containing protein n=1 Tax=Hypothenemus hampei TaxID=57062 RepID=A0ABD1E5Q9_HYPHA
MSDLRQVNCEFLLEFIQMYRSLPCIWKVKSNEYSNRIIKNKAYEKLLTKLRETDKDATIATVKKKIDSLRGSFRKELKKVKESYKSGAGTEETYKPHLWYYDHLQFLTDQEITRPGIDNVADNNNDRGSPEKISAFALKPILISPFFSFSLFKYVGRM